MREDAYTKTIRTEYICGGMEYRVEVVAELMGHCIMDYTITKVWAMGSKGKYVRVYPYDLQLWGECMSIDIAKALQEELI